MHLIQDQLHNDHCLLQLSLDCLNKEINHFDFDSLQDPDMEVILNILDYIRVYSDKWHHPTEDIIFKQLLAKKTKEGKLIEELSKEHSAINKETEKVTELFQAATEDFIVPAGELMDSMRHYISLQRVHVDKENTFIYPLMDKLLSPKEWLEIEKKVQTQTDPLFNKPSKKEFTQLYNHILELEEEK